MSEATTRFSQDDVIRGMGMLQSICQAVPDTIASLRAFLAKPPAEQPNEAATIINHLSVSFTSVRKILIPIHIVLKRCATVRQGALHLSEMSATSATELLWNLACAVIHAAEIYAWIPGKQAWANNNEEFGAICGEFEQARAALQAATPAEVEKTLAALREALQIYQAAYQAAQTVAPSPGWHFKALLANWPQVRGALATIPMPTQKELGICRSESRWEIECVQRQDALGWDESAAESKSSCAQTPSLTTPGTIQAASAKGAEPKYVFAKISNLPANRRGKYYLCFEDESKKVDAIRGLHMIECLLKQEGTCADVLEIEARLAVDRPSRTISEDEALADSHGHEERNQFDRGHDSMTDPATTKEIEDTKAAMQRLQEMSNDAEMRGDARRVKELDAQVEQANTWIKEQERLQSEKSKKRGRSGSEKEKARNRLKNALTDALQTLKNEEMPKLAEHFEKRIVYESYTYKYNPMPTICWIFGIPSLVAEKLPPGS